MKANPLPLLLLLSFFACGSPENPEVPDVDEEGLLSLVFRETFSSAPVPLDVIQGGQFSVVGGSYLLEGPANLPSLGNVSLHRIALANGYSIRVTATAQNDSAWDDVALVFDYIDSQNYLFASFNEQSDAYTSGLFRMSSGHLS